MTKYPNSECDSHRDVTTSAPVCIVCMDREIEALRQDAERYRWLREQSNLVAGMRGEGIGMACGNWSKDDQDKRALDAAIDAAMAGANT